MNSLTLTRAPRRTWPWVLGTLAVLTLLALLALGSGLSWLMHAGADLHDGVHVVVDGEDWHGEGPGAVLAVLAGLLAGGVALVVGLLAVVVVVPLSVAVSLLGVALGIAAALAAVLAVAAALLLPLWLPLLLLWWALRRRPAGR